MNISELKPVIKCTVVPDGETLLLLQDGEEYTVDDLPLPAQQASYILQRFDGSATVADVLRDERAAGVSEELASALVQSFFESGLLDKNAGADYVSGIECILELEDLQNRLLYETLYRNIFWNKCQDPQQVPLSVFYGMAIENYHFLFRESWFDSPILGLPLSTEARVLMNEFYCEEYGHDELILKSLNEIGISREQIYQTVPLPETLALCNSLAHWAATDPVFFFSTMGVLEGKDLKIDSYVSAMENSQNVAPEFIKHIKNHSAINLQDQHGNLSREIFKRIGVVSRADLERMKRQTHLFIDIYDRFYTAIWQHYSSSEQWLRLVHN